MCRSIKKLTSYPIRGESHSALPIVDNNHPPLLGSELNIYSAPHQVDSLVLSPVVVMGVNCGVCCENDIKK